MPEVTAIIPTWNRRELLVRLIERIRGQTLAVSEILVVDNGSADGSADAARALGARVLEMGRNAGFAAAVNRGIRETGTEWAAIVNNDVIPRPDWLERLLNAAAAPGVWFATGKLVRAAEPDVLDGTFDLVARSGCAWRCGQGRKDGADWDRAMPIRMAPFTAAIFKRKVFDCAGPLDERFESYLEDVDFGLRLMAKGLGGVYVPEAVAAHEGSATLGAWHPDTVRRMARNQVWLVAKHFRGNSWWPVAAGQLLWGLVALRHGGGIAWLRGKWEGARRFHEMRGDGGGAVPENLLAESERLILEYQRKTRFDAYWRAYFRLAPPREGAGGNVVPGKAE